MGVEVRVLSKSDICTNELKKLGLIIDRNCPLELRVDDMLIFYLSTT